MPDRQHCKHSSIGLEGILHAFNIHNERNKKSRIRIDWRRRKEKFECSLAGDDGKIKSKTPIGRAL